MTPPPPQPIPIPWKLFSMKINDGDSLPEVRLFNGLLSDGSVCIVDTIKK